LMGFAALYPSYPLKYSARPERFRAWMLEFSCIVRGSGK
jgi:hypothetical protein